MKTSPEDLDVASMDLFLLPLLPVARQGEASRSHSGSDVVDTIKSYIYLNVKRDRQVMKSKSLL